MFGKKIEDMTQDEKLNYMFDYIRKEKRSKTIGFIFKLCFRGVVIFIGYNMYTNAQKFNMEKMFNEYVVPRLSSLAGDISKNMINDMTKNMGSLSGGMGLNIDKDMIGNIQSQMSDDMINKLQTQISQQMMDKIQTQISQQMMDQLQTSMGEDFQKKMLKVIQVTVAKQVQKEIQKSLTGTGFIDKNIR